MSNSQTREDRRAAARYLKRKGLASPGNAERIAREAQAAGMSVQDYYHAAYETGTHWKPEGEEER